MRELNEIDFPLTHFADLLDCGAIVPCGNLLLKCEYVQVRTIAKS